MVGQHQTRKLESPGSMRSLSSAALRADPLASPRNDGG